MAKDRDKKQSKSTVDWTEVETQLKNTFESCLSQIGTLIEQAPKYQKNQNGLYELEPDKLRYQGYFKAVLNIDKSKENLDHKKLKKDYQKVVNASNQKSFSYDEANRTLTSASNQIKLVPHFSRNEGKRKGEVENDYAATQEWIPIYTDELHPDDYSKNCLFAAYNYIFSLQNVISQLHEGKITLRFLLELLTNKVTQIFGKKPSQFEQWLNSIEKDAIYLDKLTKNPFVVDDTTEELAIVLLEFYSKFLKIINEKAVATAENENKSNEILANYLGGSKIVETLMKLTMKKDDDDEEKSTVTSQLEFACEILNDRISAYRKIKADKLIPKLEEFDTQLGFHNREDEEYQKIQNQVTTLVYGSLISKQAKNKMQEAENLLKDKLTEIITLEQEIQQGNFDNLQKIAGSISEIQNIIIKANRIRIGFFPNNIHIYWPTDALANIHGMTALENIFKNNNSEENPIRFWHLRDQLEKKLKFLQSQIRNLENKEAKPDPKSTAPLTTPVEQVEKIKPDQVPTGTTKKHRPITKELLERLKSDAVTLEEIEITQENFVDRYNKLEKFSIDLQKSELIELLSFALMPNKKSRVSAHIPDTTKITLSNTEDSMRTTLFHLEKEITSNAFINKAKKLLENYVPYYKKINEIERQIESAKNALEVDQAIAQYYQLRAEIGFPATSYLTPRKSDRSYRKLKSENRTLLQKRLVDLEDKIDERTKQFENEHTKKLNMQIKNILKNVVTTTELERTFSKKILESKLTKDMTPSLAECKYMNFSEALNFLHDQVLMLEKDASGSLKQKLTQIDKVLSAHANDVHLGFTQDVNANAEKIILELQNIQKKQPSFMQRVVNFFKLEDANKKESKPDDTPKIDGHS